MKQLTKEQRMEVYKGAIESLKRFKKLEKAGIYVDYGTCWALFYSYQKLKYSTVGIIFIMEWALEQFPEFAALKPKRPYSYTYWWKQENFDIRIKKLQSIIS